MMLNDGAKVCDPARMKVAQLCALRERLVEFVLQRYLLVASFGLVHLKFR